MDSRQHRITDTTKYGPEAGAGARCWRGAIAISLLAGGNIALHSSSVINATGGIGGAARNYGRIIGNRWNWRKRSCWRWYFGVMGISRLVGKLEMVELAL